MGHGNPCPVQANSIPAGRIGKRRRRVNGKAQRAA